MSQQDRSALLDEFIDPLGRCLTPDVAKHVARLRASPALEQRIQELCHKCNEGQLTLEEKADYETIARFIKFISVLQSKARALIKNEASG